MRKHVISPRTKFLRPPLPTAGFPPPPIACFRAIRSSRSIRAKNRTAILVCTFFPPQRLQIARRKRCISERITRNISPPTEKRHVSPQATPMARLPYTIFPQRPPTARKSLRSPNFRRKTEKRSSALRAFTAHITRLRARRSTPFFQTTLPQTKIFPIA